MNKVAEIFQTIENNITPEKAARLKGTSILFNIEGQKYLADFNQEAGPYIRNVSEAEAKCTITVNDASSWADIVSGTVSPTTAFMTGKLKVKGDMSLAMKLSALI